MLRQYRAAATSAAILLLACSATVLAQTAEPRDLTTDLTSAPRRAIAEVKRARAHVNPLEAPDTSLAYAEIGDGLDPQGAMTKRGPVDAADLAARAFGSFGIPYTTTRVQEGNRSASSTDANRLSTTYPYRAVGKLTFRVGSGSAHCTASVIRRGIIVTAAHCIQNFGSGASLFTNFQFQPGHYGATGATAQQIAPHGTWTPFRVTRATGWVNGTDVGCGSARQNDLAVMAIQKRNGQFIGSTVGYFNYGWNNYSFVSSPKTGNLRTAAVSTLGYPGLMDLGRIMQRTDGPTYTTTVCGAPQLWQGSNLTGGASGGPWVVNLSGRNAALSGGAAVGSQSVMAVVGVTSWGSADPNAPKDNYASQFGQNSAFPAANYGGYGAGNIGSLLNSLCSTAAPEGGTLASQGYCG
jgi:V8-like Glu-specific endopeptidase